MVLTTTSHHNFATAQLAPLHQRAHLLVTTAPPLPSSGMMREAAPPAAVLGSAMMGTPPRLRAAPRMKSTCMRSSVGSWFIKTGADKQSTECAAGQAACLGTVEVLPAVIETPDATIHIHPTWPPMPE